jgi:hypothetical protein
MKNIAFILITALALAGCNNDPRLKMPQEGTFGKTFNTESAVTVEEVVTALDTSNNIPVQVTGTVSQYCKGEGCWLTLKNNDGEDLYVEVKDKAYVLPHNIENKKATAMGVAVKDSVDGKVEVKIVAEGIVIEKK